MDEHEERVLSVCGPSKKSSFVVSFLMLSPTTSNSNFAFGSKVYGGMFAWRAWHATFVFTIPA